MITWIDATALDVGDSHRVLVKSPKLYDADLNAESVAEGVLLPSNDDGTRDAECAVWDNHQDRFYSITIEGVETVMLLPT